MKFDNPMMQTMEDHWSQWIISNLFQALDKTPDDKLDWAPAEKMIQLGKIFLHIAECTDWWYDEIMLGNEAVELAFEDKPCPPKDQILIHLKEYEERMERLLAEPQEVFEKTYIKKLESREIKQTGYWICMHLFEHDIHHRCQINQYLRMLGIDPPRI